MSKELWCEKWRPQEYEDVVGVDSDFVSLIQKDMPNLILVGRAGTGKTSLAKVIIKKNGYEHLLLNASDERGIDVIRDKVKMFAATQSMNDKMKIVFLDEADYLTTEAQTSLRNIIETYSKICRFILTANYANKIIEPLKSRCMTYEFSLPAKEQVNQLLDKIAKAEEMTYEQTIIKVIVDNQYPDIRGMINTLQRLSLKEGIVQVSDVVKQITDNVKEIYSYLKTGVFPSARQVYLNNALAEEQLIRELYDLVINDKEIPSSQKTEIIFELADCQRWLPQVAMKNIEMEKTFLKIIQCLKH